jgi:glycosyltransferase involved in cell wall biosynthesis
MHVLQVVPYYAPAWAFGGPPKVMWEEARELVRLGEDVEVITTDALDATSRSPGPVDSIEEGVRIHRLRNRSNWLAYHRYRSTPEGLHRAFRRSDPNIIHLSETRHELAIAAWWAASRRDIPLALSAFGTLPRRGGFKGRVRGLYDRPFVTPMLERAAALLAQTNHEADLYVSGGGHADRVRLLPLGTDPPPPPGDPPQLGVPPDVPVVLFLGRIHALKGVDRLLQAFAAVVRRRSDAHLVVAGRNDGALDSLRRLTADLGVSDRVSFPGPIYGAARYDAYRRASLFAITPTHFEETSLASLEAAAVGTPLLVSAEAEAPFLQEYGAGWTVPAGVDPAPLLEEALAAKLDEVGSNARRMIQERHTWAVVGAQLAGILAHAIVE